MNRSELQAAFVGLSWLSCGGLVGMRWGCFAALGIGLAAGFLGTAAGLYISILSEDLDLKLIHLSERRPRFGMLLRCAEGLAFLAVLAALLVLPFVLALYYRAPHPG
jgi:hypothetical protein